jgi:acetolactate synthase-1/2/3 large subunit
VATDKRKAEKTPEAQSSASTSDVAPERELLSGGDMLIRALQDAGVEYIFGYPGGSALHIYDAIFKQQKIEHILVRHEQAATHMADAYARATGQAGVVLVTSGPGATNAVTGIATAYMDSIPMVVISGQVPNNVIGTDAFQETDMVGVSRPVVKHSFIVKRPEDIPEMVWKAFHIATTGRPGPVVIDVPKDTTDPDVTAPYSYPERIRMRSYNPAVKGNGRQIRKAATALLDARRPVIYAGGGVVTGEGTEALTRLAKNLNFPVTNTLMGLGGFPGDDEQFIGMLGMHGTYEANMTMHQADVILAVGARFDDRVTNNPQKFCPDATIIHIDVDPASISKIIEAQIPIVGQVASVLQDLNDSIEALMGKDPARPDSEALARWWDQINGWREAHGLDHQMAVEPGKPILPQQAIQALYRVTDGDAFITSDVGQHQMFAAQYYQFAKPRRWINSGGLGTMGFGLPAAMGVQFAFPEATVACVTGEGSFMMNMQELSTCLQYGLPIKIVNLNNQALGMVKQWQDMQYGGRHSQSTYSDSLPDFKTLVEAFGHVGFKVERGEDLNPAIEEAFSDDLKGRTVFVDIWVDPHEHVYPMAIKGGSMQDMHLSKITTSIQGDYM